MRRERLKSVLKTLPGFAISIFFIWWTYIRRHADGKRGFDPQAFRALHLNSPVWIIAVVGFCICGYTMRCFRWWRMLKHTGAKFTSCARVFVTALAANNVLPLRIGDIMRVFTYAGDVNATPSIVLSTVILEKLLDVFTLAAMLVFTMQFGKGVPPHVRMVAQTCVGISAAGLLVLVFGARKLHGPVQRLAAHSKSKIVGKIEHWLTLAIECIEQIGIGGTLMLVVYSFVAWTFEGLMYLSMSHLIGMAVSWVGPLQATTEANLSFLIPSSPGGIGPFELACQDAMVRHGASVADGALFGLIIHVWLLLALTSVGGTLFLVHRAHEAMRRPLVEEVEALPSPIDL